MPRIHFHDATPERVRRRLGEIEAEQRFRAGVYARAVGGLLAATLLGLLFIALGLMSSSATAGPALFWFGVLGADLAFGAVLVWAYLQLEE